MANINIGDSCDSCSGGKLIFKETPHGIHYGKIECALCGKWYKFVPKPNPEGIRKKVSKLDIQQVCSFYKIKKPFCFFCLREQQQLNFNETLTRDHIQEIEKGGKDEVENLQILCSACHKLKNWMRLYNNWHRK